MKSIITQCVTIIKHKFENETLCDCGKVVTVASLGEIMVKTTPQFGATNLSSKLPCILFDSWFVARNLVSFFDKIGPLTMYNAAWLIDFWTLKLTDSQARHPIRGIWDQLRHFWPTDWTLTGTMLYLLSVKRRYQPKPPVKVTSSLNTTASQKDILWVMKREEKRPTDEKFRMLNTKIKTKS